MQYSFMSLFKKFLSTHHVLESTQDAEYMQDTTANTFCPHGAYNLTQLITQPQSWQLSQ